MTFSEIYKNTRMPTSNPCKKCGSAAERDRVCIARARWWDAGVMKISKQVKRDGKGKNDRGV